jgi:hypothetical protein
MRALTLALVVAVSVLAAAPQALAQAADASAG